MNVLTFEGEFDFLTNFFERQIVVLSSVWDTTEHFFQAMKTDDEDSQRLVRKAETPGRAQRLGRRLAQMYPRDDWVDNLDGQVMMIALRAKFSQHADLAERLVAIDGLIVEGNLHHDNNWGDCSCRKCEAITGKNRLGLGLMIVRYELRGLIEAATVKYNPDGAGTLES